MHFCCFFAMMVRACVPHPAASSLPYRPAAKIASTRPDPCVADPHPHTHTHNDAQEVDIGLAADLGTLARLPRITGNGSLLRELAFTGRNFGAADALALGLISRALPSPAETLAAAEALAREIAAKSPVAVFGTKVHLNYGRDHSVADALDYITTWNAAALQTKDIEASVAAALTKGKPSFSKL